MYLRSLLFLLTLSLTGISCQQSGRYSHPLPAAADTNVVIPPAWAFGVLYGGYTNQEQTIERIKQIQQHDYPIDAYWIDSWFWSFDDRGDGPDKYIDFVADTIAFPDRRAMWTFMEENNIKGGFWTWDAIQKTGNEEAFADFAEKGYFKDVYMNTNPWHNSGTSTAMFQDDPDREGTPTGNIDFDNPEAAAYFKQQMKHFFDEGADFVKLDRTWNLATLRTIFEMTQEFGKETKGRGFMLSHKAGLDDPEYKRYPAKWTSDTRSDWTIKSPNKEFASWVPKVALTEEIELVTDPDNPVSKIPFLAKDTGGFDKGETDELDEELYIRWMQFSMFGSITESFSQPENPTSNLAWKYSERADTLYRKYAHHRMQLFPYIYSYAHLTRLTGQDMVRSIPGHLYQYLFGDEMLVAPVHVQGATEREVFLPDGEWTHYWSGRTFAGGSTYQIDAPIDEIPVFIRSGSIIPSRDYASSIETGSNDHLRLTMYEGDGEFTLIEDDGLSNDYLEGIYAKTEITQQSNAENRTIHIGKVQGYYEGISPKRDWTLDLRTQREVGRVTVNGSEQEFQATENGIKMSLISMDKGAGIKVRIEYSDEAK